MENLINSKNRPNKKIFYGYLLFFLIGIMLEGLLLTDVWRISYGGYGGGEGLILPSIIFIFIIIVFGVSTVIVPIKGVYYKIIQFLVALCTGFALTSVGLVFIWVPAFQSINIAGVVNVNLILNTIIISVVLTCARMIVYRYPRIERIFTSYFGIIIIVILLAIFLSVHFINLISSANKKITEIENTWLDTNWPIYKNNEFGFQIRYRNDFIDLGEKEFTSYIKAVDPKFRIIKRLQMPGSNQQKIAGDLQISISTSRDAILSCTSESSIGNLPVLESSIREINGVNFTRYDVSEQALSNRLSEVVYSTVHNNVCYRLEIIVSGVGFNNNLDISSKTAGDEKVKYGLPFSFLDAYETLGSSVATFNFYK